MAEEGGDFLAQRGIQRGEAGLPGAPGAGRGLAGGCGGLSLLEWVVVGSSSVGVGGDLAHVQVELFHTQLASAYMDTIIRSRDEKDQEEQTRKKFRSIVVRFV